MQGWVKIHRTIQSWEWYNDSKMVHLFLHLLLSANHKDGSWRGIDVKRGQLIFGRKTASERTGISEQSIRTCLERLKSTNEITIKSTNKYSILTICKYEDYQLKEDESTSKLTNKQPATNQQSTTNKNEEKEKNEKEFTIKVNDFNKSVGLDKVDIDKFLNHWLQYGGEKLHYQKQKTFDIKRRLSTWKLNSKRYGQDKRNNGEPKAAIQRTYDTDPLEEIEKLRERNRKARESKA